MAAMPIGAVAKGGNAEATDSLAGDEKVNVAFRTVDKSNLMSGISSVNVAELIDKNYSTYSLDNMAALVGGYNGNLWGQDGVLVLVDGVPREATNILPTEIEQITFMKSASSVVLYGSRAAKGAILITTKRGKNDGLQIKVRGNATLNVPKSYPKYLGAAEYMTLYNEARANDGLDAYYSDETIYNTASGKNPYRYPDVNFFSDDYIKKSYNRYDATAEFSGGGKYAHFYTNINFYNIGNLIKFGEGKHNHTNRLSVRGNVDLKLNDDITGWVNTSATFYDARNDNSSFWSSSATLRPERFSPLIPISYIESTDNNSLSIANNAKIIDGQYLLGGSQENSTNPFAAMYAAGYNKWTSRNFQFDTGVNIALDKVLKGLSFRTQFAVDYATSYSTSINNGYATYQATWNNYSGGDLISSLTKYNKDESTGTQNLSSSAETQTMMLSGQFNYNRTFGKVHNLAVTLLANGWQQTISGEYHRTSSANLGLQASYSYKDKYYADLGLAAVHSAKLAEGHREALSPTLSLAWRLNKEKFLENAKFIDDLKLNASIATLNQDLDISDYYMYEDIFTSTGTWWGWSETSNSLQSADSRRASNYDLTFVKRKEFTVGVDASLWEGLVKLSSNFFVTKTEGLITTNAELYPNYFKTYYPESTFIPYINYNNARRTGFDFSVQLHKKFGEFDITLGANGMYYTSKRTRVSENVSEDYLRTEGQAIDAIWGLQSAGFYRDAEDVANSPSSSYGTVQAGDIKYVDQNGDGIIDSNDFVVIGKWTAPFNCGFNLTLKWRNFTLYAMMTGNLGGQGIKNSSYYWVYGNGKYSEIVRNRWTEETAATATYPRLTTSTNAGNNFQTSDFWMYNTDRFDLQRVQLTYDLPKSLFAKSFIKGMSVYLIGNSLLTLSYDRELMETNIGSAPQCRSYNLGLTVDL